MSIRILVLLRIMLAHFNQIFDEAIEKNKKKGWNDFKCLYRPQKYKSSDIYKIMEASLFTTAIV